MSDTPTTETPAEETHLVPSIPEKFSLEETHDLIADFTTMLCSIGDHFGLDPDGTGIKATRVRNGTKVNINIDNLLNRAEAYLNTATPANDAPKPFCHSIN